MAQTGCHVLIRWTARQRSLTSTVRRGAVAIAQPTGGDNTPMGVSPPIIPSCSPRARSPQLRSRPSFTGRNRPEGMVPPSPGRSAYLGKVRSRPRRFASRRATHCPLGSPFTRTSLLWVTTLSRHSGRGGTSTRFPPFSLISQTLDRVRRQRCQLTLVAPCGPNRFGMPT